MLGGLWSTYWYNGATYGSEIARGFDVWDLTPTDQLSENEIEAAQEVQVDRLNVQHQDQLDVGAELRGRAFVHRSARALG